MSHTTRRKSEIKDADALKKAVKRIPGASYLGIGKGKGSVRGTGHQVQLPEWHYPVTINQETGECTFDNYGGRWGDEKHLDSLKQGYAVEAAKAMAEARDLDFEETQLADGSIKCVIPLGGDYEVSGDSTCSDGWGGV